MKWHNESSLSVFVIYINICQQFSITLFLPSTALLQNVLVSLVANGSDKSMVTGTIAGSHIDENIKRRYISYVSRPAIFACNPNLMDVSDL